MVRIVFGVAAVVVIPVVWLGLLFAHLFAWVKECVGFAAMYTEGVLYGFSRLSETKDDNGTD